MRKKFSVILVLVLAAVLLLVSCAQEGVPSIPDEEEKQVKGIVTGGDASLGDAVNLKDINVEQQGENTVITMYFLNGSRVAGESESKISAVPEYSVQMLSAPFRMQVDLSVSYWDYAENNETYNNSVLYGVFSTIHSGSQGKISVFFQLNENVEATVKEDSDKLVITLAPEPRTGQEAYFVGLNAYEAYEQNLIPEDTGLTPTMCDGLADIMLISAPLKDEASAKKLAEEIGLKIANAVPAKKAYSFTMDTNALPPYNKDADTESVKEEPVVMKDGTPSALPVLVENGRYLCTTGQGNIIYARSYVPNSGEDVEQVLKEKLWMIETNGKKTQLELPDFYSVEKAAVSADGRYIGILDSGIENKVLYVYDMQDNILHNLGEEGLGTITTSFAWDAEKPVVYAMSGLGTSQGANALQLVKYDFSKEAGSRVDAIGGEMPGADSKITLVGGKIYFVDKGTQEIYSVDIATESREVVAQGIDFAVAPDGNNIAAVVPVVEEGEGSEDVTFNIVITNLSTKEQTEVIQGIGEGESPSLGFDAGSDILYFTMYSYEGATPEYQVAILKYTISTAELSLLEYSKTERIMPGLNAGEIYIINYYSQNEDSFYVTYVQTEK
ncbi:hypothetical protein [Christensenella intestinihominis]|uniref:hypothetical protein n=1 Tax=Christensenella intestinihominis TaxID=1851429 RepID=UPI00082B825D|nr:hypothetical protein [Christensenella intestinihominis]